MINSDFLFDKNTGYRFEKDQHIGFKKIDFSIFRNAIIQPEIFEEKVLAMGLYCDNQFIDCCKSLEYTVRNKQKSPSAKFHISDEKVIYIGQMLKCWGHFITDSISTLWFFIDNDLNEKFKNYKIAYLAVEGFQITGNYARLFSLLNIDIDRMICVEEPTMFNEVIVPQCSFFAEEVGGTHLFNDKYKAIIDHLKKSVKDSNVRFGKKIYFTNNAFSKTKKTFGLEKVDSFFKKHGFDVIHPEKYTLDEQIAMLNNCDFFASTDGSCGHNSVFLSDGAKAIIIPRGPDLSGYQECLCFVHDVDFYYIDSTLSIFTPFKKTHVGPMYYYVSEELHSFFGEGITNYKKYCHENFYDLKKYISYGLSLNRIFNSSNVHSQKLLYYLSMTKKLSYFSRIKKFAVSLFR